MGSINSKLTKNKKIAIAGLLLAIAFLFSFTPFLGFINTPWGQAITTLNIIYGVLIITSFYIFQKNIILISLFWGTFYGIVSLIDSYVLFPSPAFQNPAISILPRMLWGFVVGSIFSSTLPKPGVYQLENHKKWWILALVNAFLITTANTGLVLPILFIFNPSQASFFGSLILFNYLPELALSMIVFVPVSLFLIRYLG